MYFNCNFSYFFLLRFHQSADGCNKNTMEWKKKSVTHIHTLRFPSWPRFSAGIQRSTRDLAFFVMLFNFQFYFPPIHCFCFRSIDALPVFTISCFFFAPDAMNFPLSIFVIIPSLRFSLVASSRRVFIIIHSSLNSWDLGHQKKNGKRWQKQHTRPAWDWRRVGNQLSHWVHWSKPGPKLERLRNCPVPDATVKKISLARAKLQIYNWNKKLA